MLRTTRALVLLVSLGGVASAAPGDTSRSPSAAAPSALTAPEIEQNAERLVQQRQQLKNEIERVKRARSEAHQRTVTGGRAYVRLARVGLLPAGGGFDDLLAHARRLERLRHSVLSSVETESRLAARHTQLSQQLTQVREQLEVYDTHARTLARAHKALVDADERRLAFERAFSSSNSGPYTAVYAAAAGPADPSELGQGFATMRGRLPFPLPGRTEIRVARRDSGGSGLEMQAAIAAPVRAVYPGRVAFAHEYADYGKTVILDHGGGYFTLSANLAQLDVQVGDEVATGSQLGLAGPLEAGFGTYFEVRAEAKTLEAADWFGI